MVDEKVTSDGGDDRSTSSSSADSNECFLELLGLSTFNDVSTKEEEVIVDCCNTLITTNDDNTPVVTVLEVPHRCSRYLHHPSDCAAFVIDSFLNVAECEQLIHLANKLSSTGFHYVTEASHMDSDGITHIVKLQEANKHKLSVYEHTPTIKMLWKKMEPIIQPHIRKFIAHTNCGRPIGLNPRLRVLRYDATDNDVFEPHFDATTKVDNTTSLLTVLIYLNVDFSGGETCYLDHHISRNIDSCTKIVPSMGKVVIFEHDLYHSSIPLECGTKYVLRTDVLFDINKSDGSVGVDKPRGQENKEDGDDDRILCTLQDVCQLLEFSEEDKQSLEELGLLDMTLDALFAPGVLAVKQMLHDALDERQATLLMKAAIQARE